MNDWGLKIKAVSGLVKQTFDWRQSLSSRIPDKLQAPELNLFLT